MTKESLDQTLLRLLGDPELVEAWWSSPNRAFEYECPKNMPLLVVERYLMAYMNGSYL